MTPKPIICFNIVTDYESKLPRASARGIQGLIFMNKKRLKDIAKILKVSTATISRATNDRYGISKRTREKILKKLKKINYQPNFIAKSLSQRKTSTIGVVIPSIEYSFFPELVRGIEAVASRKNYQIILCHSNESLNKENKEIQILLNKRVDGLIIAPVQGKSGARIYRDLLIKESVPFVLVTRYFKTVPTNYVGCDDRKGGYLAVKHLLELGHTRIAHIVGRHGISPYYDRLVGYKNALRDYGKHFDKKLIVTVKNMLNPDSGYQAMQKLLNMDNPPTAIFSMNDLIAVGALRASEDHNLKVPGDISLVGFDDVFWASLIKPSLTTISQPKSEIGEKSAELLLEEIKHKELSKTHKNKPRKIFLEPKLIVRESTANIKILGTL